MSTDELAEIDGHKPKVLLEDGEDREVGSQSRYHNPFASLRLLTPTFSSANPLTKSSAPGTIISGTPFRDRRPFCWLTFPSSCPVRALIFSLLILTHPRR